MYKVVPPTSLKRYLVIARLTNQGWVEKTPGVSLLCGNMVILFGFRSDNWMLLRLDEDGALKHEDKNVYTIDMLWDLLDCKPPSDQWELDPYAQDL